MGDSPIGESNGKKLAYLHRDRLANVLYSDGLREDVVSRGKSCRKNLLDNRLTSDQLLYKKIATEYNKRGVDEYDPAQCPVLLSRGIVISRSDSH
jgi:hypothetical protein